VYASGSSLAQETRATFGYSEVCFGPAGSSGDSPSRSQVLSDDSSSGTPTSCLAYADATPARLSGKVPVGENVLSAACQQLADANLEPAMVGSILAMVMVVAVIVHLRRAFTVCCCSLQSGRDMYSCTTRSVLVLLATGLVGGITSYARLVWLSEGLRQRCRECL